MITTTFISIVSALTALVASIGGPFVTLYVARAQIRVTVLANNRQRWIDEFREQIAHFRAEIAVAAQMRGKIVKDGRIVIQAEPELLNTFNKLIFTTNKIRLMINPVDPAHQELLETLNGLIERWRTALDEQDLYAEGEQIADRIVSMSLGIIRHEWKLVQQGS